MMRILLIILACIALAGGNFLIYKNNQLATQVAELKENLANRETLIEIQNAQIEKNALDLENYKEKKQESDTKIHTKYKKVYITSNTCEAELKSIKDSLRVFYSN